MTIEKLLQQAKEQLRNQDITTPSLDAEVLLAYTLDKPKEFLYTYPREEIPSSQAEKFQKLIDRRSDHEPLAYITGYKEFYGLDFKISRDVLVPRQETELLVRETLASIPRHRKFNLFDIGAGSGCIVISLTHILEQEKNLGKIFAIEKNKKALEVARENASRHNLAGKIEFISSDVLNHFLNNHQEYKNDLQRFNIIAANLPYLTPEQFQNSPSIKYEPKESLIASEQGLGYYKKLLEQLQRLNISFLLICEIDPSHPESLRKIISQTLPESQMEIKKDLAGKDRLAKIIYSASK